MKNAHKVFSCVFILINFSLILYFYFFANLGFLEGAPGWILLVIGAPVTFLAIPFFKIVPKFLSSLLFQYFLVSLLFQLQYQAILHFLFKMKLKMKFFKATIFILIVITIIICAKKMREIVLPSLDEMSKMTSQP